MVHATSARIVGRPVLPILDRDPSLRIAFEVRTRNEWFDLQPILRQYRRVGAPPA